MRYTTKQIGKAKVENSAREGRFRVSLLKMDMIRSVPGNDYVPEISFQRVRAAIQYSVMDRYSGQWQNQTIYCGANELRQLRDALDRIIDSGASDEEVSSPSEGDEVLRRETLLKNL